MEILSNSALRGDDLMDLPPGFRFHPTDEELITHYLTEKAADAAFTAVAIGEVDMNKVEPWDLPWRAKLGEKEWYFFCVRDKKYPTGLRTNRATAAGYWKATGKDKEIYLGKTLVGMKKTLVFYRGRAPKGEKSNWVCHEYRLEGKFSLPKPTKHDWVISRVFQKTSGGKKVHISGLVRTNYPELPPLMDHPPAFVKTKPELVESESGSGHVHCFSNNIPSSSIPGHLDSFAAAGSAFPWIQPAGNGFGFPGSVPIQDPAVLRSFLASYGQNMDLGFRKEREMVSVSQDTENSSVVSNLEMGKKAFHESQDLECIWNY